MARHQLSGPGPGRPAGSRNRLSGQFLRDLLADWQEFGAQAIRLMRIKDPGAYCRLIAGILPRELMIENTNSTVKDLDDNTLDLMIEEFQRRLGEPAEPMALIENKTDKVTNGRRSEEKK
jgi:hypothetical protein